MASTTEDKVVLQTEADWFVNDEPVIEDTDPQLAAALARAEEDLKAGRYYTAEQVRERVASWRTRFTSPKVR